MKKEPKVNEVNRLRNQNRKSPIAKSELNKKILLAQEGCIKSRNQVVEQNIGLPLYIVGRHYNWASPQDQEDFVQEGVMGLMRAIETYEPQRELEFSTYAFWWIKQKIQRYRADTAHMIRQPIYSQEIKRKYDKIAKDDPTLEHDDIVDQVCKEKNTNPATVQFIVETDYKVGSMNVQSEDGSEWEPSCVMDFSSIEDLDIKYLMGFLTYKQKRIVEARLTGKTLKEIGEKEGVSRERIRQIHEAAIKMMQTVADLRSPV